MTDQLALAILLLISSGLLITFHWIALRVIVIFLIFAVALELILRLWRRR